MRTLHLSLRLLSLLIALVLLSAILFSRAVVAESDAWIAKRCEELKGGLVKFEGRAREIREEIDEKERELGWLQLFQNSLEDPVLYATAGGRLLLAGVLAEYLRFKQVKGRPNLPDVFIGKLGELPEFVNQWAKRVRTELPQLREARAQEQTEVARQIFILRESSESLNCSGSSTDGQAAALKRILGTWRADETGSVVEITPDGYGVLREGGRNSIGYGFSPGDTSLRNFQAVDDAIEAELLIRASKEDCPLLSALPVKATIRVQPDRTFILTAPVYTYCLNICRWSDDTTNTLTRTYRRVD